MSTNALTYISSSEELAACIRSEILSATFDKKLVLAFDDDLGTGQEGRPLQRVLEVLREMKKDVRYARILSHLELIHGSAKSIGSRANDFIREGNARVYLFAKNGEEAREELQGVSSMANTVFIDEAGFRSKAYYPLAEIVAITLAQMVDNSIPADKLLTSLAIGDKTLELASINIESIERNGATFIVKLLPKSEEHDTKRLIERYAKVKTFLEAA